MSPITNGHSRGPLAKVRTTWVPNGHSVTPKGKRQAATSSAHGAPDRGRTATKKAPSASMAKASGSTLVCSLRTDRNWYGVSVTSMLVSGPGAVSVEGCSAPAYVVAKHVAYLVRADRTIVNQVLQEPAVHRNHAVTDPKSVMTREHLGYHNPAF